MYGPDAAGLSRGCHNLSVVPAQAGTHTPSGS